MSNLDGMSRDEAIIHLVTEGGLDLKDAKAFWKENRPAPRPSFKKRYYEELGAGKMKEARFEELVDGEGGNVLAHQAAHRMVWELAQKIWS